MKILRFLSLPLVAALVVPVLTTGSAPAAVPAEPAPQVPVLERVRAAHHPGFDRVVFDFKGGLPTSIRVRYVDELLGEFSGEPVPVAGRAVVRVRFEPAQAHIGARPTVPNRRAFALPNVMTMVRAGDFEATTRFGLGLAKRTPLTVFTLRNPDRVVIDVRAGFRTVDRKVWFFKPDRFVANKEPYFVPRMRPVRPRTPATGVMDRLFAGPLPREKANGLRLLRSRATGYTGLRIDNGVARVQLTGGCSSGGSTVTIAGSIFPTLKQLDTVDRVKIYDPAGDTLNPTGRTDSLPECLQP
jgi:hypothetical protein